jgi:chromate transporter
MELLQLFLTVLLLAAVSFGGGQTLLVGLERELVQTGVISPTQFATAVALGQSTPGPLAASTTAVGNYALGIPGAIVATTAMLVVSLGAALLISRLPITWLRHPAVQRGLAGVPLYVMALVPFLALRILLSAAPGAGWLVPAAIVVLVGGGRLLKAPTPLLMLGAVATGMWLL